jgi:hypothetical protein
MRDGITIQVDPDRLMLALEQNRSTHAEAYEKAKLGYIKVTTKQVEEYLTRLANGELLERAYLPAPPEDHTSDYDDAIEMMRWAKDDTIELTQQQFRQYVMDDWGWKDNWVTSNTAYLQA